MKLSSVVIPVYKNYEMIEELFDRLLNIKNQLKRVEFIFVIDGPQEPSEILIKNLLGKYKLTAQVIVLSRNFGAVRASRFGLMHAKGDYLTILAADLQEPAHLHVEMIKKLQSGESEVVIGVRENRDDPFLSKMFSRIAWKLLQKTVIKELPDGGFDTYAVTKKVFGHLNSMTEPNFSPISQLLWLGFDFSQVLYNRERRKSGKSTWKFKAKIRYLVDSVVGISNFPFKILTYFATVTLISSLAFAAVTLWSRILHGVAVPGYATLTVLILFSIFIQQISTLIIGAYLWRNYQATLNRPIAVSSRHYEFK